MVRPGITTKELDKYARDFLIINQVKSAFLGYKKFPAVLCTSVNDKGIHGVPSNYVLKNGDIIDLDLGIKHKGYFADMSKTIPVGQVNQKAKHLIKTTKNALIEGIAQAKPGNAIEDIGNAIENYVLKKGLKISRDFCGHGIGKKLHQLPNVRNYGTKGKGLKLKEGMVICIEPLVIGDGLKAHFEHMVLITKTGNKILTI